MELNRKDEVTITEPMRVTFRWRQILSLPVSCRIIADGVNEHGWARSGDFCYQTLSETLDALRSKVNFGDQINADQIWNGLRLALAVKAGVNLESITA